MINSRHTDLAPASLRYPNLTLIPSIQWQIQVHPGFCSAFVSSARHAPAARQHESWRRLGLLRKDKILIFVASHDPIIVAKELKEDATKVLGADKVEWRLIDGAHDIPATDSGKIVNEICGCWEI